MMKDKRGNCFESAGRWMLENGRGLENCFLCHGVVSGRGELEGKEIAHAWVEYEGDVIDKSNGINWRGAKDWYYILGKIDDADVVKYTFSEMVEKIVEVEHWGAWHEYREDVY